MDVRKAPDPVKRMVHLGSRSYGRMTAAGLVERRVDEGDARVRHAAITPDGKARLRAAAVTHLAGIQRHFARFVPDDEAATLRDRFEAMRGSARRE